MSNAVLTICSLNYVSKALVLLESFREYNDDSMYLLIVDRKSALQSVPKYVNIIWVADLGIENWESYAFRYDVIEFNTNVKPAAIMRLLESHEKVIYLDPDIEVFSSLDGVWADLDRFSLVLTPHYFSPILDGHKPDDIELLKFGPFNLGFIGVSRLEDSKRFLEWWSERCLSDGYYEPQSGLAVDQKWVSLAPSFFKNIKVSEDLGLNLAFWNLHERTLVFREDGIYVNNCDRLKFVHFSSFDSKRPEVIAKKQSRFLPGQKNDFSKLCVAYAKRLEEKSKNLLHEHYGFDYFDDGVYVTPALRRFYSVMVEQGKFAECSPFESQGPVREFAKRSGLASHKFRPKERLNFKNIQDKAISVKIINLFLRLSLKLLGPLRYFELMRYLSHISSLRNQRDVL